MQNRIVTENQLDEWVRGNSRAAQGLIVELVWRLVAASSPRPNERRFPLGDSIEQPGSDGDLDTDFPSGLRSLNYLLRSHMPQASMAKS